MNVSKNTNLIIITDSKNGAKNIKASRDATNLENLNQDKTQWKAALELDEKNFNKKILASGECEFSAFITSYNSKGNRKMKKNVALSKILQKMADQIFRMNSLKFEISSKQDIELWMIKQKITAILNSDPELIQLDYCRNSTRQSIDEVVQKETLSKYLPNIKIEKPSNGSLTLINGQISPKTKGKRTMSTARSIDLVLTTKSKIKGYAFCKYSGPVGSVTSVLQADEANSFLDAAMLYCDTNPNDNSKFIALIDGYAGEQHLDDFNRKIKNYPNIFAGNCEKVIGWLESLDK